MKNFSVLQKLLDEKKISYKLLDMNTDDSSVDATVKALGINFREGMSTLLFRNSKGKYVAVLRRDDRNTDFHKLYKILGSNDYKFCDETNLKTFGFEVGLASPFLLRHFYKNIQILVDDVLKENDFMVCGCTLRNKAIKINADSLFRFLGEYSFEDFTVPNAKRQDPSKSKRILTGDTPSSSGRLHLGHFVGTLENRVKLQHEYDTFILIANVHAYANYYEKSKEINSAAYQTFLDNLAVGIDPNSATIYLESGIPETFELYTFFLTMVKHSRAMRNPTVKDEINYKKLDATLGFVAYPILQAADILQFDTDLVPVGEDQMPIIEQVREIARDFNKAYGEIFKLPVGKVGKVARLVGTDGKMKMSKSGENAIFLSDDEEVLKKKVMNIFTDPKRIHATDPGTVEGNPVFTYHDAFNPDKNEVRDLKDRYKRGKVGDIEVKEKLFNALNTFLTPIREKRKYYENHPEETKEILIEGTKRARKIVQEKVAVFKEKLKLNYLIY